MAKWQKVVAVTGLAAGLALTLSACGSKKSSSDTSSNGTTTLTMYQIGDKPKHYDQLIKRANKILVKKANAKLKINYIGWGDYSQKMAVIVSSGEHYDIAKADNYTVNAQKGAYADLTKLLPKYAPTAYKQLDSAYIKGNKINGKLYAFPVNGNVYSTQVIAFNNRLVKKYNIDISKVNSYASLNKALKQFHAKDAKTVALAAGKGFKVESNFDYPLGNTLPFGVDVSDGGNTKKIVNQYDNPRMIANLTAMHQAYEAGYISQDAATSNTDYPINSLTWFARQETQGPFDYGDFQLNNTAGQKDAIVSKKITMPLKSVSQSQVFNWVVGNGSQHKKLAVKVLGLINSDKKLLNGLVWGEKGVDYKQAGTDKIKLTSKYSSDNQMAAWMTGNNKNLYTTTDITSKMIKERNSSIASAKSSPLLGFTPDTSSVKTEITNIQNVMNQYIDGLNTGTSDPKPTIKKMDKALKAAGYDKVQKLLQKQYTEFLAKQ
ncbi:ABC transporter substrate-binding protein [Lactiplantibacillus mudanjiangensis]|uniref:Sugar ABC transporter substrate-binding protein [Lactobacillus heilongjiangensis] n=1 Tax=Lactiplantibacillus mudanjiangensis TaxID=1296538 RepID=A0A660E2K6_9LACO|nr:ABC transporter substrate-binding protein [Lactiplantibacillus mudanjiangensis]VDG23836.1 sugar ABC transporter substrate-binding protein [Lactobacillus heilongjiangensis] [Lactiplantibacillus mudanjiangensis]VDG30346.1 sugar ABC transporter substrate-binding protein [Lactobacillus heilongjiangensis] [Lactiplantibacillus mudanjiangensis]